MSFEEPKAPIVRIRKKKTKKKSKGNQIVHLPVRASRQARYSSLTTPTNPQTKGRECCRRFMASCLKIPLCNKMCLGCILPPCYDAEKGSDDEGHAVKDEGYHSQVRGSSEVPVMAVAVAPASSEPSTSDATEVKTETVALIPPPRQMGNDYRQDPCCSTDSSHGACASYDQVTYIEVESVNLSDIGSAENSDEDAKSSLKDFVTRNGSDSEHGNAVEFVEMRDLSAATEYEVPVSVRHQSTVSDDVGDDVKGKVVYSVSGGSHEYTNERDIKCDSEYIECDNVDETQQYVNMDVLKYEKEDTKESETKEQEEESTDYLKVKVLTLDNGDEVDNTPHDYANLSALKGLEAENDRVSESKNDYINGLPIVNHDYINLSSLNSNSTSMEKSGDTQKGSVRVGDTNYSSQVSDNAHVMNGIQTNNEPGDANNGPISNINRGSEKNGTVLGINGNTCEIKRDIEASAITNAETGDPANELDTAQSDTETTIGNTDKESLLVKASKKNMKNGTNPDSESEDVVIHSDQVSDQTKLI